MTTSHGLESPLPSEATDQHPGDPLRVGLVGLSATRGWAAVAHLPALRAVPGFELTAVCGSTQASAEAAASAHGVSRAYADPADMLDDSTIDVVVIVVRVPRHAELIERCLRAGQVILCEWPLGVSHAEAARVTALVDEAGATGFVGLQARTAPAVRYASDLASEGYVGRVLSTSVRGYAGQWGRDVPSDQTYLVDGESGGTMQAVTLGHALDGISAVLGKVASVSSRLSITESHAVTQPGGQLVERTAPDEIALLAQFDSDVVGTVHYSGGPPPASVDGLTWHIRGSEGDLVLTSPSGQLQHGLLQIAGSRGQAPPERLTVPSSYLHVTGLPQDSFENAVAHLYATLRQELGGGPARLATFEDAVRHHALIDAVERSSQSRAWVNVDRA